MIKLMYLDDEPQNLQVLKSSFRQDFEVYTFTSHDEAYEFLQNNQVAIVVVDQRMPGMTGVEFLEKVLDISRDSVRIILTGYSDSQALMDAINKGKVFYYVTKPWKKPDLKLILLKAVDHYLLIKKNRELVKKLSGAISELETFLYRASHDLRSPITSQLGLLKLLRHEASDNTLPYVTMIEDMIQKLELLLQKMSQLSLRGYEYIDSNHKFDLQSVIEAELEKHSVPIADRKIKVKLDLAESPDFFFDHNLGSVIVGNIFENAVQYCRRVDPTINISGRFEDDESFLLITIEDNGIGVAQSIRHRIFTPFFRGNEISTGNGLGLYVARKICSEINGEIDLSSDGNSWTKVSIKLPNLKGASVAL